MLSGRLFEGGAQVVVPRIVATSSAPNVSLSIIVKFKDRRPTTQISKSTKISAADQRLKVATELKLKLGERVAKHRPLLSLSFMMFRTYEHPLLSGSQTVESCN